MPVLGGPLTVLASSSSRGVGAVPLPGVESGSAGREVATWAKVTGAAGARRKKLTVSVALRPLARRPTFQVCVPYGEKEPWLAVNSLPPENTAPAAAGRLTVTPVAVCGPLLVTVAVTE